MRDYSELRAAAMVARVNRWERAMCDFDNLTNPDVILALLDELEALRGQVASEVRDGR